MKKKLRKQTKSFVNSHRFQLFLVIFLGFIFRLYRISNPILDWHAFRQADTASVTLRYVDEGIDLLHPKYHDLSNIQSGQENPEGYRMVEFPFINGLIAKILQLIPQADLTTTSRFISIIFSLGTLIFFYWLIKQISDHKLAIISTCFVSVLPYSVYYSRVVLPEPFMLFFSTASLAYFTAHLKEKKILYWWLSVLTLALALLLKPFVLFLAPVYLALLIIFDSHWYKKLSTYLYPILALAPLYFWRNWISNFPQGIPASKWLYNQDGIRLRPAWFRWLFWERLSVLIGGYFAPIFYLSNLLKKNTLWWLLASWWSGIILYFIVIATGNVRHDYYQVLSLPCVALTLARGSLLCFEKLQILLKKQNLLNPKIGSAIIVSLISIFIIVLSWSKVKGFYNVNHWEYQKVGEEIDKLIDQDAKVIAPAMGDTMFLFQTQRLGWPIGYHIDEKIKAGATHYVSTVDDDESRELKKKYHAVKETSEFILIDLTKLR